MEGVKERPCRPQEDQWQSHGLSLDSLTAAPVPTPRDTHLRLPLGRPAWGDSAAQWEPGTNVSQRTWERDPEQRL